MKSGNCKCALNHEYSISLTLALVQTVNRAFKWTKHLSFCVSVALFETPRRLAPGSVTSTISTNPISLMEAVGVKSHRRFGTTHRPGSSGNCVKFPSFKCVTKGGIDGLTAQFQPVNMTILSGAGRSKLVDSPIPVLGLSGSTNHVSQGNLPQHPGVRFVEFI